LLKFDRSTVNDGTQNIQNDCHQWLSDSFRALQFVFGRGYAPDPTGRAYSASPDPLASLRGPTSEERRVKRGKGEKKGR